MLFCALTGQIRTRQNRVFIYTNLELSTGRVHHSAQFSTWVQSRFNVGLESPYRGIRVTLPKSDPEKEVNSEG